MERARRARGRRGAGVGLTDEERRRFAFHPATPVTGPLHDAVRAAAHALFLRRTAQGKLTEQLDVELTERTLDRLGGEMVYADVVRLQAGISAFLRYAEDACGRGARATVGELKADLKAIRDGLRALSTGVEPAGKAGR